MKIVIYFIFRYSDGAFCTNPRKVWPENPKDGQSFYIINNIGFISIKFKDAYQYNCKVTINKKNKTWKMAMFIKSCHHINNSSLLSCGIRIMSSRFRFSACYLFMTVVLKLYRLNFATSNKAAVEAWACSSLPQKMFRCKVTWWDSKNFSEN